MNQAKIRLLRKQANGLQAPRKLLLHLALMVVILISLRPQSIADDVASTNAFDIQQYYQRSGLWVIPVTVAGEPRMAVLATGSNICAVQLSDKNNEFARGCIAEQVTGTNSVLYRDLPFRFHNLPESKITALGVQMPELAEALGVPLVGCAGLPCYSSHALLLDGESGALRVIQSPVLSAEGAQVEMTVADDKAFLPVTMPVVGTRLYQMETFDTGSLQMTEDRILALERMGHLVSVPGSDETEVKDGKTIRRPDAGYILRWVDIGGIRFHNVDVVLSDRDKIGLGLLREFRITADFPQGIIWLEYIKNQRDDHFQPPGCAMRFELSSAGRIVVRDFRNDLSEEHQGLSRDDIVKSIDGIKSEEITYSGLRNILSRYGSSLALKIERDGKILPATLKLAAPKNWPPKWAPERTAMLSDFEQFVEQTSSPTVTE